MQQSKSRCSWCGNDALYIRYHDKEWGVPVHSDKRLFEFLILEGAQAGLSWITVLKKRDNYRRELDRFDFNRVAAYDDNKIQQLLQNPGLIRNRLKMQAAVRNARAYLEVRKEFGTFNRYIWQFTDGKPMQNNWKKLEDIPAKTSISDQMSKDLKQRGFTFVGSTICYAFMQATGMVNDHVTGCFRHKELQ